MSIEHMLVQPNASVIFNVKVAVPAEGPAVYLILFVPWPESIDQPIPATDQVMLYGGVPPVTVADSEFPEVPHTGAWAGGMIEHARSGG